MKTATIPTVRVSPELRHEVEALLERGESLSAFVEDAIRRNVEFRRAQREFVERGLKAGAEARQSGTYVSSDGFLGRLDAVLDSARRNRAAEE